MHYLNCLWQGMATGFALSLMLGTVFFSLIRNSIQHGYQSGVFIALGVIICDIAFIVLALLSQGFADFLSLYKKPLSILGGCILIVMGLWIFIKSNPKVQEGKAFKKGNFLYFIGNGFLLNVLNPVNFFSWLVISSYLSIEYNYELNEKVVFFVACLFSIFMAEFGIAFFASKLKKIITPLILKRIDQISALVFIGIGIKLILT